MATPLQQQGSPPLSFLFSSIFFFLLLCSSPSPAASKKAALLRMKTEWGNPRSLSSWTNTSSPYNDWNDVLCGDDGSVTAITLVDQGIQGRVPAATRTLPNLAALNLFNDSVGGTFPTSLYRCSALRFLNLSQNRFVGGIPADIHPLSRLTSLDLSINNFSGNIPPPLGRITGLTQLCLDSNRRELPSGARAPVWNCLLGRKTGGEQGGGALCRTLSGQIGGDASAGSQARPKSLQKPTGLFGQPAVGPRLKYDLALKPVGQPNLLTALVKIVGNVLSIHPI